MALAGGSALALALVGGVSLPSNATASPVPDPAATTLTPRSALRPATDPASRPGAGAAGSHYDTKTGRPVVNVLDGQAADSVREAGAVPRTVRNSTARLLAATRTLSRSAGIPGTSWSVDPRGDHVVVTADRTVTGAKLDTLNRAVKGLGDAVRFRKSPGEFKPFIAGGDAIYDGGTRCSLGFNVVKDGQPYFLTAGHCGVRLKSWSEYSGGPVIGSVKAATFPGHDYALVKYTDASAAPASAVDLYAGGTQPITQAGEAAVGQSVQRSGSTSHVRSGTVTGLNATVNYQEGSVSGLIQTDMCAEPGDSGGALFSGSTALGLTSGGNGDCTKGGETFFQPVTSALSAYGARIG